ncbi:MAG TPA: pyrroline-5-carboxylate reductase [Candidatus Angelobacter sp.]|nr:pyrroline-5-carboxylate reductase [Candidatus Angelobacter sp.]
MSTPSLSKNKAEETVGTTTKASSPVHGATPKKLAVLGCGKLGTILLQAFLERRLAEKDEVVATVQHEDKCKALSEQLGGVPFLSDNRAAVEGAPIVLICVKPQAMPQLLEEIGPVLQPNALVISVVASTTISIMQQKLGTEIPIIRAMPNTPSMVGAGMTALAAAASARAEHLELTRHLFEGVGRVVVVDEKHMDAITALSASGPAFVFVILESLAEAGVKVGLPRELATTLAAQTLFGAAQLALKTGHHPALLKDAVTTPAGCTIEGLIELEKGGLRVTLINAIIKTTNRAKELMGS